MDDGKRTFLKVAGLTAVVTVRVIPVRDERPHELGELLRDLGGPTHTVPMPARVGVRTEPAC